jgi:hypothetical protein
VTQDESGKDAEEVVFSVHGMIHARDLPPIKTKPRYCVNKQSGVMLTQKTNQTRIPSHKYKFIRQGVTLVGLGTPTFTRALEAIENIYSHFDRHLQEGTLDKHSTTVRGDGVSDELSMWNRYFTPLREAKGTQAIPFLPGVDPSGILYNMAHEDNNYRYIHSEDNQVQYFTSHRDDKGITKYVYSFIFMFHNIQLSHQ